MLDSYVVIITLVLVGITTIATLFILLYGRKELQIAGQSHRGKVYIGLSDRYSKRDMYDAIQALQNWYMHDPDNFDEIWLAQFHDKQASAIELDVHRRKLSAFFFDVLRMHELKILDKKLVRALLDRHGARVYAQICLPMGEPIYGAQKQLLARFRKIQGNFGKGRLNQTK